MLQNIISTFKSKDIRKKLLITLGLMVVFRLGNAIPVPGINTDYMKQILSGFLGTSAGLLGVLTGGSFEQMSIFALGITPYITSSIIIQLMTIAIPQLEDLKKDGKTGSEKIKKITIITALVLAVVESTALSIGFAAKGVLRTNSAGAVILCAFIMILGAAALIGIGEIIDKKGIGNGISIILLFNILSSMPSDIAAIYSMLISGKSVAVGVLSAVLALAFIAAVIVYTVILNDAVRNVPVKYSGKMSQNQFSSGTNGSLPFKVNGAGVMPVIFTSSILSLPLIIAQFCNIDYSSFGGKILMALNSSNWFRASMPAYSLGFLVYAALTIIFAYFYTWITFDPRELAETMKSRGGFIPGVRPGRPTSEYITEILKYQTFIGVIGLLIACTIPMIISGVFGIGSISFLGTSLIIIVSVVLEVMDSIGVDIKMASHKGFLLDSVTSRKSTRKSLLGLAAVKSRTA